MTAVSVYAIFADLREAERIARIAVEERLAACVNILAPCRSIYRWEGRVETAEEVPAILKTESSRAEALIARIAELHSYDTPCVTVWPIEKMLEGYGDWIGESVADKA